jgi:hypothetical protein
MEAEEVVGVEEVVEVVVPPPPPHPAKERLMVANSANIDPLSLFIIHLLFVSTAIS